MATQISFTNNALAKEKTSVLTALGYTPENAANKTAILTGTSNIFYPTEKAVKDADDLLQDQIDLKQDILFFDTTLGAFTLSDSDYES